MSEKYDKRRQIRLTPENLKLLEKTQKHFPAKVSIGSLANAAIEKGVASLLPLAQTVTK